MRKSDCLLTVVLSVATTLVITRLSEGPRNDQLFAAPQDSFKELTVDRLIVHNELIVSDTGKPWETGFEQHQIPRVRKDDGSGEHRYALIALGPQGQRSNPSASVLAGGLATLEWDSVKGADAFIVVRDGREVSGTLRIEGSSKNWTDQRGCRFRQFTSAWAE